MKPESGIFADRKQEVMPNRTRLFRAKPTLRETGAGMG
jgi:hypothetical protein